MDKDQFIEERIEILKTEVLHEELNENGWCYREIISMFRKSLEEAWIEGKFEGMLDHAKIIKYTK